jgi:hypothetical protein
MMNYCQFLKVVVAALLCIFECDCSRILDPVGRIDYPVSHVVDKGASISSSTGAREGEGGCR